MNIDLAATTGFNDASGLRNFLLVHRFVHLAESQAFQAKFGVTVSTFGIDSQAAEDAWVALMREGAAGRPIPAALRDFLQVHAFIHNQSYTLLGQSATLAPDLSVVDFGDAQQYYDWMSVHQDMHDFEYQQLGLT
jgi:hypothetical protein